MSLSSISIFQERSSFQTAVELKPARSRRPMMRAVSFSFAGGLMRFRSAYWRARASSSVSSKARATVFYNQVLGDSFGGEILLDPATAVALVFLAQPGEVGGEAFIGEIAQIFKAADDAIDRLFAGLARFGAWLHQSTQIADGTHAPG